MKGNDLRRACSRLFILAVDIDATLIQRSTECNRHADNIFYRTADIQSDRCRQEVVGEFLHKYNAEKFAVVFVSSVTMWIHMNYGDDGLCNFLRYISSIAEYVLIEPQDWKCYRAAVRRMKRLGCQSFQHFSTLEWRDDVNQQILQYLQSAACCLKLVRHLGQTESWSRSLYLFTSLSVWRTGTLLNDIILRMSSSFILLVTIVYVTLKLCNYIMQGFKAVTRIFSGGGGVTLS